MERRLYRPNLEYKAPTIVGTEVRTDPLSSVEFENFTPSQEKRVREQIAAIGLPLTNLRRIIYAPTPTNRPDVVGDYTLAGKDEGRLRLYKSLENLPEVAQFATLVHELSHQADLYDEKNTEMYGSQENRERTIAHVEAVARQTLDTRKYLNGYHKLLAHQYENGKITFKLFAQETHAILIELRYTNPKHLLQVQDAQVKRGGKIPLMTVEGSQVVEGVDSTLLNLVQNVKTYEELVAHLDAVREQFYNEQKVQAKTTPTMFAPAFIQAAAMAA